MKTFTKILALMIALVMVVSMFAACTDKKADDNKNDPPAGDTTPNDGGTTTPPAGDEGTTTPPAGDEGTTTPPAGDEGTTTPPAGDEGTTTPPADVDTSEHYAPTVGGLQVKGGVEYGWGDDGELSLDFTGSKIVKVKVDTLDASLQEALADEDLFANRVLQLAGADTFVLPEFTAENGNFFKDVYTYTISLNYYVAAGSFKIVAINGDSTRDIATAIPADGNTIEFDYVPVAGDTAIAFVTEGEGVAVYLGRMNIGLYAFGPSYNQLVAGYTFDWAKFDAMQIGGNKIQVKDIEDETIRNNIKAAGYEDDDYIIANAGRGGEGTGKETAFVWHTDHFTVGRKYIVTYTYYAAGGTGNAHFIALNGAGNHTVDSGVFAKANQVHTKSFTWEVGPSESAVIWFQAPADLYMLDITVKLDTSIDYHYSRDDVHSATADEVAAGYTFDFSEGNAVASAKIYLDVENHLSEELQAVLTAENGFGATVVDGFGFRFKESIYCAMQTGNTYTITLRVWASENLFGGALILLFNDSDVQNSGEGNEPNSAVGCSVTAVDGVANVYDLTYTVTIAADTTAYPGFFVNGPVAEQIYIGSITIAPAPAAAE